MKDQLHIQYYKWSKNHAKNLFRSCELLDMKSIQFYLPLFSLYFYIHNTPCSHKVIDLERKLTVKKEDLLYKCGWSPFEGTTFKGSVEKTLLNGQWAYNQGEFLPVSAAMALKFDR